MSEFDDNASDGPTKWTGTRQPRKRMNAHLKASLLHSVYAYTNDPTVTANAALVVAKTLWPAAKIRTARFGRSGTPERWRLECWTSMGRRLSRRFDDIQPDIDVEQALASVIERC